MVISTKMTNTIVIRRNYLHYVKKYKRFEKRHKNISCHISPCFQVKEGDIVIAGQCRPLSKTVRFNVLKVQPNDIIGNARKQFNLFWPIYQIIGLFFTLIIFITYIFFKNSSKTYLYIVFNLKFIYQLRFLLWASVRF